MTDPRLFAHRLLGLGRAGLTVARRAGFAAALDPRILLRFLRDNGPRRVGPIQLLHLHALIAPERPAIVNGDLRLTYGELDQRINRLAHALRERGIRPGDRVALLLRNGHEHLELAAAIGHLAAVAVQVGYRLKAKEIAYILDHSSPRVLLFHDDYAEVVREACAELPADRRPVAVAVPAPGSVRRAAEEGFVPYAELLADPRQRAAPIVAGGGFGSQMIYTSGTTGRAKGAHRDLSQIGFESVVHFLAALPFRHDERHLVCCPLYHSAAPVFASFAFVHGGCIVIVDHFDPPAILETIERERITSALMVPTMYSRLLALSVPTIRRHDLSSLRWLMSAAAPLPTELARRIEEAFGPILYNFYGATETGLVTLARPGEHTARPGTIGRALPGNEIRLLDGDGGEVGPGEVGELWVKNTMLVGGYHRNQEATRAALRDGFFSVGDLARRDDDGYYYLAERKHDMVISGGINIYPLEIEQRLHAHPAVVDAAVVGYPDPEWGESLAAFVVLHPGASATAGELQRFITQELADYKRPRQVRFLEALPRNPTGKVLKRELRALLAPPAAP